MPLATSIDYSSSSFCSRYFPRSIAYLKPHAPPSFKPQESFQISKLLINMGRIGNCMETAPSPLVLPQKPSHSPKLETIREDEAEEEPRDLNVESFLHFFSVLLSTSAADIWVMQLAKLSSRLATLFVD